MASVNTFNYVISYRVYNDVEGVYDDHVTFNVPKRINHSDLEKVIKDLETIHAPLTGRARVAITNVSML
jgi:hypothetical protein